MPDPRDQGNTSGTFGSTQMVMHNILYSDGLSGRSMIVGAYTNIIGHSVLDHCNGGQLRHVLGFLNPAQSAKSDSRAGKSPRSRDLTLCNEGNGNVAIPRVFPIEHTTNLNSAT